MKIREIIKVIKEPVDEGIPNGGFLSINLMTFLCVALVAYVIILLIK